MKKILLILFCVVGLNAQTNIWKLVGSNILPYNSNYLTAMRLSTATPAQVGAVRYSSGNVQYYNGTTWKTLSTTTSGGSVGNADSLGGVPASDYARLSVANTFTLRNTFPGVATDTLLGKTSTKILIPDTVFIGTQSTLNNELLNVASNTDADIKAWTASTSDLSSLNMYRSRGTLSSPSAISSGDNIGQHRAWGYYASGFIEVATMTFLDHGNTNGAIVFKIKHDNSSALVTDTSVLSLYPFGTASYGGWLGAKKGSDVPVREWTVVGRLQHRSNVYGDSLFDATRGYSVGGTTVIDNSRNITNAVAITATGLMTLGSSGSAQAHQISSASANALTLYRPQTSVGAASGLNFAGNTSNGTQVTYGTIQGLLQSASNSLQSGGLQFAVRKGGVEVKALMLDSLANAGLQVQNTSTLSDTRFWIRSSGLSLYAFSVIPAASTTKQFAVDTSGRVPVIGGTTTSGAYGLAPIVDTVNYSAVASSIASKNLTATAGTYRISYNLFTRTAGTGGTAQMTLSFNNGNAQTMTSAAINLNSANSMDDDVFVYTVASGTPTVLVTVTGATGSPTYTFRANVERLQ